MAETTAAPADPSPPKLSSLGTLPRAHAASVITLNLSPHSPQLATGGEDACLCIYDLASLSSVPAMRFRDCFAGDAVTAVHWHPTEPLVYAASGGRLYILDPRADAPIADLLLEPPASTEEEEGNELNSIAVAPWVTTDASIAVASDSGKIHVVMNKEPHLLTRGPCLAHGGHSNIVSSCSFHRPNKQGARLELISGGLDCRLIRWELSPNPRAHTTFETRQSVQSEGRMTMTPPMVQCLDTFSHAAASTSRRLESSSIPGYLRDPRIASLAACGLADGTIALYDVEMSSKLRQSRRGKSSQGLNSFASQSDGFICQVGDGLQGHRHGVTALRILPSTRLELPNNPLVPPPSYPSCPSAFHLVTGAADRRLALWRIDITQPLALQTSLVASIEGKHKINCLDACPAWTSWGWETDKASWLACAGTTSPSIQLYRIDNI